MGGRICVGEQLARQRTTSARIELDNRERTPRGPEDPMGSLPTRYRDHVGKRPDAGRGTQPMGETNPFWYLGDVEFVW